MTQEEFYDYCQTLPYNDYIVKIKARFSNASNYSIFNVVLFYDDNYRQLTWSYDWNEGQKDIEILGIICADDIEVPNNL